MKELLYADDLMLLDSWKNLEKRYAQWQSAMTEKVSKINKKRKTFFLHW